MDTNEIIEKHPKIYERDAAMIACDLVRQFITIAIGGMAFTVGAFVTSTVSLWLFWFILLAFGLSVFFGILFMMHITYRIGHDNYSIFERSIRMPVVWQVMFAAFGIFLLCIAIC